MPIAVFIAAVLLHRAEGLVDKEDHSGDVNYGVDDGFGGGQPGNNWQINTFVLGAVECAIELQRGMATANSDLPENHHIVLRGRNHRALTNLRTRHSPMGFSPRRLSRR